MKITISILLIFAMFLSCRNKTAESVRSPDTVTEAGSKLAGPKPTIKTIGILLYDGYSTLDAMGPYSVLSEMIGTKVFFVGRHKGAIEDIQGMKVLTDSSIDEVRQLDILVIPGGFAETYAATRDSALLRWIKSIDKKSAYTVSVCTGAWILGATGLLKGRDATTHWYGKKILAAEYGARVQHTRYAHSGKYWTSAGISAGIDVSLALINEIRGEKATKAAMLDLEYDPRPPFTGGSENNTDPALVAAQREAYDDGMKSILHPVEGFKTLKVANGRDLVCGMSLTAAIGDTAMYQGKIYGFCSKQCKSEFNLHRENYLPIK